MKKTGEILKEKREALGVSLDQASRETKIGKRFLAALEVGEYSLLPSLATAQGFLKNYARFLELEEEKVLAHFRRDTARPQPQVLPAGLQTPSFSWSPTKTAWLLGGAGLAVFFGYLAFQIFLLLQGR